MVYGNILEKIKKELITRRTKPRSIYFSPSSDIFQPVPEVLETGYSVLEYLLSRGVGIAFLTKGQIPGMTMKLLLAHAARVRAQIGIITPYEDIRQMFEPGAASVDERLRTMEEMISGGIEVEARLMPILPGITDTDDSIERLFSAIASAGVKRAAISTLFIRPAIAESFRKRVPMKIATQILKIYQGMERMPVHAKNSSVVPLPRPAREKIYTNVRKIAKKYGVQISVCGCMNPDMGGTCNITGEKYLVQIQPSLFGQLV